MLRLRQGIVMATALCILMLSVPAQAGRYGYYRDHGSYRSQYKYNFSPVPEQLSRLRANAAPAGTSL